MTPSSGASSTRADDGATAEVAVRVVARATTRPLGRGAVALATAFAAVARELYRATTPTAQFASYAARVVWLRKARRRRGPLVAACVCAGEMYRVNHRGRRTLGFLKANAVGTRRRRIETLVVKALATMTKGLASSKPLPTITGRVALLVAASAPYKCFVRKFAKMAARVCKIPAVRIKLQRHAKRLGKLLAKNKVKNEVSSYRAVSYTHMTLPTILLV